MNLTAGYHGQHEIAMSVQDEMEGSVRPSQFGNHRALDSAGLAPYDVQSLGEGYYPQNA